MISLGCRQQSDTIPLPASHYLASSGNHSLLPERRDRPHGPAGKIIEEVETVLPELQVASTTAEAVRLIAVSLLLELDSEKARI